MRQAQKAEPNTRRLVPTTPKAKKLAPRAAMTPGRRVSHTTFTKEDDNNLVRYLAIEKFNPRGRLGNKIFEALVNDVRAQSYSIVTF